MGMDRSGENGAAIYRVKIPVRLTRYIFLSTFTGLIVGQIKAEDADIGANADLHYKMLTHTERRGNENGMITR